MQDLYKWRFLLSVNGSSPLQVRQLAAGGQGVQDLRVWSFRLVAEVFLDPTHLSATGNLPPLDIWGKISTDFLGKRAPWLKCAMTPITPRDLAHMRQSF